MKAFFFTLNFSKKSESFLFSLFTSRTLKTHSRWSLTNGSSDVEERGSEVDSGRVHDVLVGHSEDNVSEGYQMRRKEL